MLEGIVVLDWLTHVQLGDFEARSVTLRSAGCVKHYDFGGLYPLFGWQRICSGVSTCTEGVAWRQTETLNENNVCR